MFLFTAEIYRRIVFIIVAVAITMARYSWIAAIHNWMQKNKNVWATLQHEENYCIIPDIQMLCKWFWVLQMAYNLVDLETDGISFSNTEAVMRLEA